jgi:S1-C subfamily serine protease
MGSSVVLLAIAPLLSLISPITVIASLPNSASLNNTANFAFQLAEIPAVNRSVPEIARLVTVRILTNPGVGSGVIIARRGQTYTVLTCEHVVADSRDNRYTVMTADGRSHTAVWRRSTQFGDADLALVQFTSSQSYQVAVMGSKTLSIGDTVYASGFPNWHWINKSTIENTRKLGILAFRVKKGTVGMLPALSLPEGYRIGYTNDIENGMSGGPVLDSNGQVVGINGRLKYALQGIGAYTFANGTVPSQELFQQMQALSWAIPIATFQQMVEQPFGSL